MKNEKRVYASMIIVGLLFMAFPIYFFPTISPVLAILNLLCSAVLCATGLWGISKTRTK